MKTKLLTLLILALLGTTRAADAKAPFTLSITPSDSSVDTRGITMAVRQPREFYVVLTNVSNEPQAVWEYWNGWGYQTISFEFTMPNNQRVVISKRPQYFNKNFPSTFLIPPGEHQVYPVRLDKDWDAGSTFSKLGETSVVVKAIYEVSNTPKSAQYKVWTGRVESGSYKFTLERWSTGIDRQRPTNRWTRAAGACFVTNSVRRRVLRFAPPRQLNRYMAPRAIVMAFSEKELKRIEREVGGLCKRRVPAHLQDKIRLRYAVTNQDVLIRELRPDWDDPSEWIESDIARLRYVRAADEWRLYWKRASGKWWLYEPHSPSKTLSSMVNEIDIDSDGCFFG